MVGLARAEVAQSRPNKPSVTSLVARGVASRLMLSSPICLGILHRARAFAQSSFAIRQGGTPRSITGGMPEIFSKVAGYLRQNGRAAAIEILVNFVLPYAVYSLTEKQIGDVKALMASSAPPILWSVAQFLRHRRVDAVSVF